MSTRESVLAALRAADGHPVSGEHIAATLGVSRMAIAKQVAALRAIGYDIVSSAGSGYLLLSAPPLAVPWEVRPLLTSPFWRHVEGGMSVTSTNDDAKALARDGAEEGTVVVAAEQTGGKGRLGRSWDSPVGGAYFSAVVRPSRVGVADVPSLALAVAVGVVRALASLGISARIKWPNDILVHGRKAGGILIEAAAEADSIQWVVIGVGLNVANVTESPDKVAYLTDEADVTPSQVAARALDAIAETYAEWRDAGFSALRDEYASADALSGHPVTVRDISGMVTADGVAAGVDDTGRLIVDSAAGCVFIAGGDVTLRA